MPMPTPDVLCKVLLEVLQALHRVLQGVNVLAESESGVTLADRGVFLAVELSIVMSADTASEVLLASPR